MHIAFLMHSPFLPMLGQVPVPTMYLLFPQNQKSSVLPFFEKNLQTFAKMEKGNVEKMKESRDFNYP